jgi:Xaa-Pro aminopeptidase
MSRAQKYSTRLLLFVALLVAGAQTLSAQAAFDKSEFAARRAKLFERMADGVAVVLAADSHVQPVKFRQSPDFYYLTGVEEPGAVLLLVGKTKESFVFVRPKENWELSVEGPGLLNVPKASESYGLTGVAPLADFAKSFNAASAGAKTLYVPLSPPDALQMARVEMALMERRFTSNPLYNYTPTFVQAVARLKEMQPTLAPADVNRLIDELRWVKTPYEQERVRKSAAIAAEAMSAAMRGTHPGEYEYEVEAAARFVQTRMGARGDAFTPIVASGPNTITWHYERNDRQMQAGEVVLMDYGADFDYYTSDITRTWPVSGKFTPEQEKMYRCILEARAAIIAAMKPGVTIGHLQDVSEEVYKKHGFRQQFMELGRYIGHFVGMSVHDVGPTMPNVALKPGVVFNVEPLIEFRDKQIHMRLEDTVLVTETGAENLTAAAPAEVEAVYALVKQK